MSEPFLGELRMFAFSFAPRNWAFCDGQTISANQNPGLCKLLGATYGGDGVNYFALPDLRERVPTHGKDKTIYTIGLSGGDDDITLLAGNLPTHTHRTFGSPPDETVSADPSDAFLSDGVVRGGPPAFMYRQYDPTKKNVYLSPTCVTPEGNNFSRTNMMPYTVLNFCIAMTGIFPSRP